MAALQVSVFYSPSTLNNQIWKCKCIPLLKFHYSLTESWKSVGASVRACQPSQENLCPDTAPPKGHSTFLEGLPCSLWNVNSHYHTSWDLTAIWSPLPEIHNHMAMLPGWQLLDGNMSCSLISPTHSGAVVINWSPHTSLSAYTVFLMSPWLQTHALRAMTGFLSSPFCSHHLL
jgi:hypothetical protein